jgi:hypothetical protein
MDPAAKPPWAGGGGRWTVWPKLLSAASGDLMEFGVPVYASGGELVVSRGGQAALGRYLAPESSISGLPQGGATRDSTATVNWTLPGQVGAGTPQLAITYDMSVVDQQSGRWYVKDIRASTQPMGSP